VVSFLLALAGVPEVHGASIFRVEVNTVSVSAYMAFGPTDPRRKGAGTRSTELVERLEG
jgi:hypothetical protein